MARPIRPRRSMLYMPGSNARALEKAQTLGADAFIFDLEDAVSPDAKDAARAAVCSAMKTHRYGLREKLIRVNALSSPWGHRDLTEASLSGADGILLPKVESADAVKQSISVMAQAGAPADLPIWCMMETPLGVLHAEQIAASSSRVAGFVMGTSDLTKDLHASYTRDRLPQLTSLSLCLLAARAYDLAIIDGVHIDLHDEVGFESACVQGLELGFDGKTLIHPKTIATANRVFAPSVHDVDWSKRIIEAHAQARVEGKAVVVVDGRLVEDLHVQAARRLVALSEAIELLAK